MQWLPATALVLGTLSQRHRNNVILARRFLSHSEQVLERCCVMIVCRFGSSVSPQALRSKPISTISQMLIGTMLD